MDTRHEILLEQMLEELREQTRALRELQVRMDRLEKTLSPIVKDDRQTVDGTDR